MCAFQLVCLCFDIRSSFLLFPEPCPAPSSATKLSNRQFSELRLQLSPTKQKAVGNTLHAAGILIMNVLHYARTLGNTCMLHLLLQLSSEETFKCRPNCCKTGVLYHHVSLLLRCRSKLLHDRNDSLNPVLPGNTNAIAHIQVQTDDFMRNRNNNAQLTVHTAGHVASAKT